MPRGVPRLRVVVTVLIAVPLVVAAYWSSFEFYWEGWGLPYPEPLAYLVPVTLACVLGLVAVTWPRLGGRILSVGGGGVGVAVAALAISRGMAANAVVWFIFAGLAVLLCRDQRLLAPYRVEPIRRWPP